MSYTDSYFRQYERRETTVNTILENLSKGGVQSDYASQWAAYYRSQGMSREADMIETYVRGLEAGRQSVMAAVTAQTGGRSDLPMGGGTGYGTPANCYRCDKTGHFARECPEFTGVRPAVTREIDSGPRNIPCRDGDKCKFINLPGGCRYLHEGVQNTGGGTTNVCYRCQGVGHFARDCPTFTGVRRDSTPSGGGPMRRVQHPGKDQPPGTSECYRCNKIGHFARECPDYTGAPYPNAYRGRVAPSGGDPYASSYAYSRGRPEHQGAVVPAIAHSAGRGRGCPGEYGTSKCLKCNSHGHHIDNGPRNIPCRDGPACKFLHLPGGCRYLHEGINTPALTYTGAPVLSKDVVDPIDEAAGDQVLSASDLEDL